MDQFQGYGLASASLTVARGAANKVTRESWWGVGAGEDSAQLGASWG